VTPAGDDETLVEVRAICTLPGQGSLCKH
jgi:hypothetical protein